LPGQDLHFGSSSVSSLESVGDSPIRKQKLSSNF
jgi:hypothetical protein